MPPPPNLRTGPDGLKAVDWSQGIAFSSTQAMLKLLPDAYKGPDKAAGTETLIHGFLLRRVRAKAAAQATGALAQATGALAQATGARNAHPKCFSEADSRPSGKHMREFDNEEAAAELNVSHSL
jgi:hypothetical protein